MFWRRNHLDTYNQLNPKCAAIFHPMVDALGERSGGSTSASYFSDAAVRRRSPHYRAPAGCQEQYNSVQDPAFRLRNMSLNALLSSATELAWIL